MATIKVNEFLSSQYAITKDDGYRLGSHLMDNFFNDGSDAIISVDFSDMLVVASPFLNTLAHTISNFIDSDKKSFYVRPNFLRLCVKGVDPALWQKIVYSNFLYLTNDKYRDAVDAAVAIEATEQQ